MQYRLPRDTRGVGGGPQGVRAAMRKPGEDDMLMESSDRLALFRPCHCHRSPIALSVSLSLPESLAPHASNSLPNSTLACAPSSTSPGARRTAWFTPTNVQPASAKRKSLSTRAASTIRGHRQSSRRIWQLVRRRADQRLVYRESCILFGFLEEGMARHCTHRTALLMSCMCFSLGMRLQFKTAFSLNIASPCLCTAEFNPTCSSDGTVASNPCLATKCGTQQALFSCDIDFENPKASYDDEIQECEELCLAQVRE